MRLTLLAVLLAACTVEVRVPPPVAPVAPLAIAAPEPPAAGAPCASADASQLAFDIERIVNDAVSSLDHMNVDEDSTDEDAAEPAQPPTPDRDRDRDRDRDDDDDDD